MSVQDRNDTYRADQRSHFDELTEEDWDDNDFAVCGRLWNFEVARLFSVVRPKSILNLGCGCGFQDKQMAGYSFVESIRGLDYSPKSVEMANARYAHPIVQREVADFSEFKSGTLYDLVVSFQVIEHLEEPESLIRLSRDCCKPGGHVAVFTPNRLRPYNRKRLAAGKEIEFEDPMHSVEFTLDELEALGVKNGLRVRRSFCYGSFDLGLPLWFSLWLSLYVPGLGDRMLVVFDKI